MHEKLVLSVCFLHRKIFYNFLPKLLIFWIRKFLKREMCFFKI